MAYIVLTQVQMLTYRWGRTYDFAEMARACCMLPSYSLSSIFLTLDTLPPPLFPPCLSFNFSSGMNVVEAMHFVSHSRTHVKEGVISPSEDDPFGYSMKGEEG